MKPTAGIPNIVGAVHQTERLLHSLQRLGSLRGILIGLDLKIMERMGHKLQRVIQPNRQNNVAVPHGQRNLGQTVLGTASFLTVVQDERMRAAVRRKLQRCLSPEPARQFGVTTIERIQQALAQLETGQRMESANLQTPKNISRVL